MLHAETLYPPPRVMTYRRIPFGHSSAIILFVTTIFCLHPRSIAA